MADSIEDLKRKLKRKREKPEGYLSTGNTLLNLALTDDPHKGFSIGHFNLLVGQSKSGKTWQALSCLAEASINPFFDGYRLIFDCPEDGAQMDLGRYFPRLSKRIEVPNPSFTVEDFYYSLDDALTGSKPVVYVLDSMDALQAEADVEKFKERKKAARENKEAPGGYGMAKAKLNSTNLNHVVSKLKKTGSMLLMISQARDNTGQGYEKDTRSGGRALTFYATIECWFSLKEKIRKTVMKKPEVVGSWFQIRVKKNRQTGGEPTIDVPFYKDHGMDDTRTCINFLVERGHWKGNDTSVTAPEFDYDGKWFGLIKHVEDNGLEDKLRGIAADLWAKIREACREERKNRYA